MSQSSQAEGGARSPVLYVVEEGVATITLNKPEKRNAFDGPMLERIVEAFDRAREDADARVVVFTGAGDAFCAGGDVTAMGRGAAEGEADRARHETVQLFPRAVRSVGKPVIARINGYAVGAGLDLALHCDLRIVVNDALLSEGYINVGLVAGEGGAYLLPRLVGLSAATELLLTGRSFTGAEAAAMGMVNRAVPREELDEAVGALARTLASKPQQALRTMKELIHQSLDAPFGMAMTLGAAQVAILSAGGEHARAVAQFREARSRRTTR